MKPLFLTLLVAVTFSLTAQVYQYQPFPDSNANWKWRVFTELMVPVGWQNEVYTDASDTMVGSTGSYYELNKMVFYRFKDSADFELIYDFNISVGDTFFTKKYGWIQDSKDVIVSDDSSGTDPIFPNRRIIKFYNGVRWVEGIGNVSSHYAMPYSLNNVPTSISGGGTVFRCQYSDGQSYPCPDANILGSEELELNEITSYPNPVKDKMTIEGLDPNATIHLFNSIGQELPLGDSPMYNQIDCSGLKNGIYVLSIETKSERSILKFIKD